MTDKSTTFLPKHLHDVPFDPQKSYIETDYDKGILWHHYDTIDI